MEKHFVRFLSPGTFVSEETTKEIPVWDVQKALLMSKKITERYGATPYAFQFITRGRKDDELDSHIVKRSGTYYINGVVETLEEIKAKHSPSNSILISNMEYNNWPAVVTVTNKGSWTQPFCKEDRVVTI